MFKAAKQPDIPTLSKDDTPRYGLGILCVILATLIFAGQDAITKTLVAKYDVTFIVMVRYWIFLVFSVYMIHLKPGGIKVNAKTSRLMIQVLRGILLLSELLVLGVAFRYAGLAEVTAVFQSYSLFGTVFAIFLLHEVVGWRRILALCIGFLGILIMLRPGSEIASLGALLSLAGAILFALYMALTRLVSDKDSSETSFFYVGVVGCVIMTAGIPLFWESMDSHDIILLVILCITSVTGHFLMIKALSLAPLTVVQPFYYLQLVWSVVMGYFIFSNFPDIWTFVGAFLVVGSGLFVFYREQMRAASLKP